MWLLRSALTSKTFRRRKPACGISRHLKSRVAVFQSASHLISGRLSLRFLNPYEEPGAPNKGDRGGARCFRPTYFGFPVEARGAEQLHGPFFKRKPHAWSSLVLRKRKSGQRWCEHGAHLRSCRDRCGWRESCGIQRRVDSTLSRKNCTAYTCADRGARGTNDERCRASPYFKRNPGHPQTFHRSTRKLPKRQPEVARNWKAHRYPSSSCFSKGKFDPKKFGV